MEPVSAYAQLNARIMPCHRGECYEDPLQEALDANGWAAVAGGGTLQRQNGEIEYCGIDIDLRDIDRGVPFICEVLEACGAPKGSKLIYQIDGDEKEVPFGRLEGLAIYFNGTDLPDDVYRNCDINYVCSEIDRLLGERGAIQGHWQGPTETAVYLYGYSINEMKRAIAAFMADYPLCQKARLEVIA
jgi:hypothetical protein